MRRVLLASKPVPISTWLRPTASVVPVICLPWASFEPVKHLVSTHVIDRTENGALFCIDNVQPKYSVNDINACVSDLLMSTPRGKTAPTEPTAKCFVTVADLDSLLNSIGLSGRTQSLWPSQSGLQQPIWCRQTAHRRASWLLSEWRDSKTIPWPVTHYHASVNCYSIASRATGSSSATQEA